MSAALVPDGCEIIVATAGDGGRLKSSLELPVPSESIASSAINGLRGVLFNPTCSLVSFRGEGERLRVLLGRRIRCKTDDVEVDARSELSSTVAVG